MYHNCSYSEMPEQKSDTKKVAPSHIFWYAKTKTNNDGEMTILPGSIEIDLVEFLQFLYDQGFRFTKIFDNGVLYQVRNNKILEEIETSQVRQFVVKWIQALGEEIQCNSRNGSIQGTIHPKLLLEKIIKGVGFYFDTKKLEAYLGPREQVTMNQDTDGNKFIYFQNGYLHINARGMEFMNYTELTGYIWASEIIPRDFDIELGKDEKYEGTVPRFFYLVANGSDPKDIDKEEKERRMSRMVDLCRIAGYLSHAYTDYTLKCPLLTDSRMSASNEPNGRSGKTLFMRMVGGMLCADPRKPGQKTCLEISGKNFDPADTFRYGQASHETKLIYINDVKRKFDPQNLFNDITDGLEVNKKNQQPFKILVKMAIIANMSIDLSGESSQDRFCVFEFAPYFSLRYRPSDEFGHFFFRDWDHKNYCQYYWFMAKCIQRFFSEGSTLPDPESINYSARVLREHTSREFIEYMEQVWRPEADAEYNIKEKYEEFLQQYNDWIKRKLLQARFTEWVKKYMNHSTQWANFSDENGVNSKRDAQNRYVIFRKS